MEDGSSLLPSLTPPHIINTVKDLRYLHVCALFEKKVDKCKKRD